jgi:hypothetical protein
MANQKCVGLKCEVKDIFDKKLTDPVLEQMEETIQALIDGSKAKGLYYDKRCKDGWLLTAKVVKLEVDDPDNPTSMEVKVAIDGLPLHGTADAFNASGKRKVGGINAKKIEQEAKSIVHDALETLMNKQVLPHMTKP